MAAKLNARIRTDHGKGAARTLRRDGFVPAVVYGHGDDTRSLTIQTLELEKLVSSISVENTVIDLAVEGAKTTQALIREIQYHPARRQILHLDLYQIHAGEKIHLEIPIHLQGAPIGVREEGGVLQEVLRDLEVECLPRDIPQSFDIDISQLGIGDSVHVRDLSLPNVRILNDPELVICVVAAPSVAALPEPAESEDGVGGEVEPELIRDGDDDAADTPAEQGQG